MSKLGLLVFLISFQAAYTQDKAVTPRNSTLKNTQSKDNAKATELFNAGVFEFDKENFDVAAIKFMDASKQENISQEEKSVALYNTALSFEKSKKYRKAIEVYTLISVNERAKKPSGNNKGTTNNDEEYKYLFNPLGNYGAWSREAYYRIGACCHELKDWACIIGSIENWKNYGSALSLSEEFEYRIRKGTALYELKLYKDAIEYLESATKVIDSKKSFIYTDAKKRGFEEGKINLLEVWGLEALANSYKTTGDSIKISYSEESESKINMESLSRLLEIKGYYYLKAQEAYLKMLDYGDRESATKGLFLLGELFKDIYNNLLSSEIPPDIKGLRLEKDYIKKLKESLSPILKKAKTTYSKNIELAEKYKFTNEWIEKSRAALKNI